MSNQSCSSSSNNQQAYTTALLRTLQFSGVKFLRYTTLDACNNIRAKVKPVDFLLKHNATLDDQVSVAQVCYAGLPHYADFIVPTTGLDAKDVLKVQPDLGTLRILPYAPKTAVVMGSLMDQYSNTPSCLDTRALLQSIMDKAARDYNLEFSVGVELEFCLVDAKTGQFVDDSVFANAVTLNDQEPFLEDLYDQLQRQYIPVELIHSESGPGQLEVVLEYSNNPLVMADNVVLARETIRNVARAHGMKALFLPKYDMAKAGNGMHIHLSFHSASSNHSNTNATQCTDFAVPGQPGTLTPTAKSFLEGILQHLPALMGLSVPTVNSFHRIGRGCWTGSVVGWAVEDKESALRVCSNLQTQAWDHLEYKLCDHSGNLYLTLAGVLAAGLEGIAKSLELRPCIDDSTESPAINETVCSSKDSVMVNAPLPGTIQEALDALEKDALLKSVMGEKLSRGYLGLRRNEAERAASLSLEDEIKEALARA